MPCYLVIAYRWGWKNNHQYFVGCWTNKETAISFAVRENTERGGKYGVTVYLFEGDESKVVHHSPSSHGEKEPYCNRRIELFERFGNQFVPVVLGEIDGDLSIEEMKRFVNQENEILDIIYQSSESSQ